MLLNQLLNGLFYWNGIHVVRYILILLKIDSKYFEYLFKEIFNLCGIESTIKWVILFTWNGWCKIVFHVPKKATQNILTSFSNHISNFFRIGFLLLAHQFLRKPKNSWKPVSKYFECLFLCKFSLEYYSLPSPYLRLF